MGRFYCIYKQNGATLSVTEDLKAYTVLGSLDCGENYAQTYAETFGNASLGIAWSDTLTGWLYL